MTETIKTHFGKSAVSTTAGFANPVPPSPSRGECVCVTVLQIAHPSDSRLLIPPRIRGTLMQLNSSSVVIACKYNSTMKYSRRAGTAIAAPGPRSSCRQATTIRNQISLCSASPLQRRTTDTRPRCPCRSSWTRDGAAGTAPSRSRRR